MQLPLPLGSWCEVHRAAGLRRADIEVPFNASSCSVAVEHLRRFGTANISEYAEQPTGSSGRSSLSMVWLTQQTALLWSLDRDILLILSTSYDHRFWLQCFKVRKWVASYSDEVRDLILRAFIPERFRAFAEESYTRWR